MRSGVWTWASVAVLCSGCLLGVRLPLVEDVSVDTELPDPDDSDTEDAPDDTEDEPDPDEVDGDEDGYSPNQGDCDDKDEDRSPGADEIVADGVDQDCDGLDTCYADNDDDGWGTDEAFAEVAVEVGCVDGDLASANALDCDDGDDDVAPTSLEVAGDGVDNDCNGEELCFVDGDQDGFGTTAAVGTTSPPCLTSSRQATNNDDCDDTSGAVSPAAREVLNLRDDDCDGGIDDDIYDLCVQLDLLTEVQLTVQESDGAGGWQPALVWNQGTGQWVAPAGAHELSATGPGEDCTRLSVQPGASLRVEGEWQGATADLDDPSIFHLDQCLVPVVELDVWFRSAAGGGSARLQAYVEVSWDEPELYCDTELHGLVQVPCIGSGCTCAPAATTPRCDGYEISEVDSCGVVRAGASCASTRTTCSDPGAGGSCVAYLSEGMLCESPLSPGLKLAMSQLNPLPDGLLCGGLSCGAVGLANPALVGPVYMQRPVDETIGGPGTVAMLAAGDFRCYRPLVTGGTRDDVDNDQDCFCEHGQSCAARAGCLTVWPGDCDDGDVTVYPGATEVVGDLFDNNCDGRVDR